MDDKASIKYILIEDSLEGKIIAEFSSRNVTQIFKKGN